jgi:hypothetical protein
MMDVRDDKKTIFDIISMDFAGIHPEILALI